MGTTRTISFNDMLYSKMSMRVMDGKRTGKEKSINNLVNKAVIEYLDKDKDKKNNVA